MRVVLDANLPVAFGAFLVGHYVESVHQQNLRGRPIAILVLRARSNRMQDLETLVQAVIAALPGALPGEVTLVNV